MQRHLHAHTSASATLSLDSRHAMGTQSTYVPLYFLTGVWETRVGSWFIGRADAARNST